MIAWPWSHACVWNIWDVCGRPPERLPTAGLIVAVCGRLLLARIGMFAVGELSHARMACTCRSPLNGNMDEFLQIDWRSVFFPSVGVAEIFLRGTIVYFFLFFILRLLRREA